MYKNLKVGVIIPARNEELAISQVVSDLRDLLDDDGNRIIDTIVVCDNGSTDCTAEYARAAGALVAYEPTPGYGRACLTAASALPPVDVILYVDGDRSLFASQCIRLLDGIVNGDDLALGARTKGFIEPGALTTPQIFGNQLAVFLIRKIWRVGFSDLGPFRAIRYSSYQKIRMQDQAYGWTIEMQVKAVQAGMQCNEYPVDSRCRLGVSKISGTVRGVIGAGVGILGMVFRLWWRERSSKTTATPLPEIKIASQ
jgi:glycosyltransferase involved in cell wall biosynthesis